MLLKELHSEPGVYEHKCPGCDRNHLIPTHPSQYSSGQWKFNGNLNSPSFTPSVNISATDANGKLHYRCHYFITDGQIQYCPDCTHSLAGQTVPLPDDL